MLVEEANVLLADVVEMVPAKPGNRRPYSAAAPRPPLTSLGTKPACVPTLFDLFPGHLLTSPRGVSKMRPKMVCNMFNMVHMESNDFGLQPFENAISYVLAMGWLESSLSGS